MGQYKKLRKERKRMKCDYGCYCHGCQVSNLNCVILIRLLTGNFSGFETTKLVYFIFKNIRL